MEFLLSEDDEALYGGAARGGKSDALLMGALQFVEYPGYSSLIIRKTFTDLSQADGLIPRSHVWLAGRGVKWNTQEHRWEWPNGSMLSFGYLDSAQAHFRYMGGRYQYIAIDELTHHEENQVRYLATRLSRPMGMLIPTRLRMTAMPGGKGHQWVKQRYILTKQARFIQARIEDNPSEDKESYIRSVGLADAVSQRQALEGDWDVIAGARISPEWIHYHNRVKGAGGWWLHVGPYRVNIDECERFITIDTASTAREKTKPDPDYTVISSWARWRNLLIWLGCARHQVEMPAIPVLVAKEYQRFKIGIAYVEETGQNKPSQWLKMQQLPMGGYMNVLGYSKGSKDKLIFNTPFINMMAAERVWMPGDDPTFPLGDVQGELLLFTGNDKLDSHDDIVDTGGAAAMVINRVGSDIGLGSGFEDDYGVQIFNDGKGKYG